MKAAITQLEISLETLVTNEPINRAAGNTEQAALEAVSASEIRQALAVLEVADAEVEKEVIERQIKYAEEALRGEYGEEIKRKEEARQQVNPLWDRITEQNKEERKRLAMALGSPALVKACLDEFDYAAKLKSGEVIRFSSAKWHDNGWITLSGVEHQDDLAEGSQLPFPAERGVDVRLENILWVMDAPCGS